jgi:orc1/cdc6 family replication initiation protein
MIEDARYLRSGFVPSEVVHRDPEVNHLSNVLRPLVDGEPADTVFITGPTGSGKTCIAKFTVDRLRQNNLDIESIYINCWNDHTRFQVLNDTLEEVHNTVDIHRQSTSHDVLLDRLRDHDGPPCVVTLDEVDQLEDKKLLYELNQMQGFSLILIANDRDELLAKVNDRLASRLRGAEQIRFHRYISDELVDILSERAKRGLVPDSIADEELETIADDASGDARVAIATLRIAAKQAERDIAEKITSDRVEAAAPNARKEIRQKNLESLTDHQRAVYDVIKEYGEIAPSELYQEYKTRVKNPKSDRTIRNYLQKMKRYNLVRAEGSTQDRIYHCIESAATDS